MLYSSFICNSCVSTRTDSDVKHPTQALINGHSTLTPPVSSIASPANMMTRMGMMMMSVEAQGGGRGEGLMVM